MFPFRKKVKEGEVEYATFNARLFSLAVDIFLLALIVSPIFIILSNILYSDKLPGEIFLEAYKRSLDYNFKSFSETLNFILNDYEYRKYMVDNFGYYRILIDTVIQILITVSFFFIFWKKKQTTPGKMIISLKIVDSKTLIAPSTKQLLIRAFFAIVSVLFIFIGFLWIFFNKRRQSWHDIVAGTVVIKNKE